MAFCKNCGAQMEDGNAFCASGGASTSSGAQANPQNAQQQYASYPGVDPTDHTAEFDPADISKNKPFAMAPYLLGLLGLIIALLAAPQSPYVAFHARQALKILVLQTFVALVAAILFWTLLVPVAGMICMLILVVVQIISFFSVCSGKAKEPPIVSSFGFLK